MRFPYLAFVACLLTVPAFAQAPDPAPPLAAGDAALPPRFPRSTQARQAAQPPTQPQAAAEALSEMLQMSMQRELEGRIQIKVLIARIHMLETDLAAARESAAKDPALN